MGVALYVATFRGLVFVFLIVALVCQIVRIHRTHVDVLLVFAISLKLQAWIELWIGIGWCCGNGLRG